MKIKLKPDMKRVTVSWSALHLRTILCMDALELEEGAGARLQAGGEHLWRELAKCLTGFSACRGRDVATGAWGCGVFGGDRDVKLGRRLRGRLRYD